MPKVVLTFIGGVEFTGICDGAEDVSEGSGPYRSEMIFELCERHFDWVQVWAVRWEVEKPTPYGF